MNPIFAKISIYPISYIVNVWKSGLWAPSEDEVGYATTITMISLTLEQFIWLQRLELGNVQ